MRRTTKATSSSADVSAAHFDLATVRTTSDTVARTRPRIFGLTEAPTFYPSKAEFVDPIQYIQKIRHEGEKYGIIKIVPPKDYNPGFCLNTEVFRFRTRIQEPNNMEGETRANGNYLKKLRIYHRLYGGRPVKIPQLDKRPIDLFKLKKEVAERGGYQTVTQQKKWAEVGRVLGYARKQCTSMSNALKMAFLNIILPYENWLAKHKQEAVSNPPSPQASPQDTSSSQSSPSQGSQLCEVCQRDDNENEILLCDGCDRGYHLRCLSPPLSAVPKTDWFCFKCLTAAGGDYGFEDGEEYSLETFQKVCNKFKQEWFSKNANDDSPQEGQEGQEGQEVTEEDCEDEFWRLAENPHETCEVEYGADLHSTQHGSGFASIERNTALANDTWNLNMIPVLPRSLFTHIKSDISGMMVPWLYVGMCFSAFCWHNEDHHTYSINYMHWGETKTWYGIPGDDTEKFEETMRNAVPELFEQQPDLLFQLVTMLSPGRLMAENVRVYAVDQRPGQFVVTFPKAYHSGFNHGFNFCEAVNFAPWEWVDHGLDCVKRYKTYRRQPCFSHDELLVTAATNDKTVETARYLKKHVLEMKDRELAERADMCKQYPRIEQSLMEVDENNDPELQCQFCHCYTYLSHIACECTAKVSCLEHHAELCSCDITKKRMCLRLSDEQLNALVSQVHALASVPSPWSKKASCVMEGTPPPTLKALRHLLVDAEKMSASQEEIEVVQDRIDRVTAWIDEANRYLVRKHRRREPTKDKDALLPKKAADRHDRMLELLKEAPALSFDAPEINQLKDAAEKLAIFIEKANEALKDPYMGPKALVKVSALGDGLQEGTEEMTLLNKAVNRAEWHQRAPLVLHLAAPCSTDEVTEWLDLGRCYEIDENDPTMQVLIAKEKEGRTWIERANAILAGKGTFNDMDAVIRDTDHVSFEPTLLKQVRDMKDRTARLLYELPRFVAQSSLPVFGDRPSSAELARLQKVAQALPKATTQDMEMLTNATERVTAWEKKAKSVLTRGTTRPRALSLESALDDMSRNVQTITHPGDAEVFCLCRMPESGLMIECDVCGEWYHNACVHLKQREAKQQSSYVCPVCDVQVSRVADKRPTLDEMIGLVEEAETLSVVPEAYRPMKALVEWVQSYRDRVQAFCRSKRQLGMEDLRGIKSHVRELEGLLVVLPDELAFLRKKIQLLSPAQAGPSTADATQPTHDVKTEGVYCVCRRGYDEREQMVGCDTCHDWFHLKCVNLTSDALASMEHYMCPGCARKERHIIKITLKPPTAPVSTKKRKQTHTETVGQPSRSPKRRTAHTEEDADRPSRMPKDTRVWEGRIKTDRSTLMPSLTDTRRPSTSSSLTSCL